MDPIYTSNNTTPAFQLNWTVSLFGTAAFPAQDTWLEELRSVTESDGVRILEFHLRQPNVAHFFVSTRPGIVPTQIIRSLKGRWQYLIRQTRAKAFRRNYFIGSVGNANSQAMDRYIGKQASKHQMADPNVQKRIHTMQYANPDLDLALPRLGHHGKFVYNLQVVIENAGNYHTTENGVLSDMRSMLLRLSDAKKWLLARIGLVSNHVHVSVGPKLADSPEYVALSIMNNLAYVQGMKPVFRFSYYVGTFGPYDRNAVRRGLCS